MSHEAFQEFYQVLYQDRWPELNQSLLQNEVQMARWNQWAGDHPCFLEQAQRHQLDPKAFHVLKGIFLAEQKVVPVKTEKDVLDFYVMDPASAFAARALDVQDGDRVLDMCAAPGGKSLILIEALQTSGEIICNDLSADRRERLKKVIQHYVPRSVRDRVWIKGQDAVQFGLREPESFDRILLDAPCSGERHVLADPRALSEWSPKRPRGLEQRQYALLSAAFLALKPEGHLVYSTCSLNPEENDGVVQRLLEKRKEFIEALPLDTSLLAGGEQTRYGVIFLPDRCGYGPLYVSRLFKRNSFKSK